MPVAVKVYDSVDVYEVSYAGIVSSKDLSYSRCRVSQILDEKCYSGIYDHTNVMYTPDSLQQIEQFAYSNTILLHPNLISFGFVIPNLQHSPRAKAILDFCTKHNLLNKAVVCTNIQQARERFVEEGVHHCKSILALHGR